MAQQTKEVRGPHGRGRGGPRPKLEHPMKTFRQVLGYVGKRY